MLTRAERETKRKALSLRSDNGRDFENQRVDQLLSKRGLQHERSAPHVKQGNGIAERENRILCDTARTLLFNADLTRFERLRLWGEALNTAAYLRNRVPNKRTDEKTPYECWFNVKPDLSHLRVFGSPAFVKIPEVAPKKMDPRSRKTVFVGYDPNTDKILRLFDRTIGVARRVDRVSDVQVVDTDADFTSVFNISSAAANNERDEKDGRGDGEHRDEEEENENEDIPEQERKEEEHEREDSEEEEEDHFRDAVDEPVQQSILKPVTFTIPHSTAGSQKQKPTPNVRIPTRVPPTVVTRSKAKTTQAKALAQAAMSVALDPVSREDALARHDANKWITAMDEEMHALHKNQTWSLVRKPAGKNLISAKWVLKSKTNPDGSLARRKARLVARGFSQTHGVDYFETFAPVVRYESVRCVLSLAAAKKMTVHQFDVKTAFLHGDIDEEVYMEQPAGYEDGTNRVCKLRKSLYGMKQSPRKWNEKFTCFLAKEKLIAIPEDPCVFVRKTGTDILIVCLYVDDGLVAGTNSNQVTSFLSKLTSAFEVAVDHANTYVGMEIHQDKKSQAIKINQRGFIGRVLERFGLADSQEAKTPMNPSADMNVEDSQEVDCPYREAIGCLNYISLISRPDITFAVNKLARYSNSPKNVHWQAVKRVMRYLKGSIDYSITYTGRGISGELVGNCDSDWAGCTATRRSTTGYLFMMNNGPVCWSSRLQQTIALSVTEAEYMALADALTECLWLRELLSSLDQRIEKPVALNIDNQAAIHLSQNPEFHKRTKHVAVKYHRVRQEQANKIVSVSYVPTEENVADILTKGVTAAVLEKNLPRIGFY